MSCLETRLSSPPPFVRLLFLFVVAVAGAQAIPVLAQAPAPSLRTAVFITPGDYVRVTVWRKPELSGEFLVAADSSLKHPLYQDVKVAGATVAAAQERVRTYLLRLEATPQVSIDPLFQVAVGGEVRNPNLYRLAPETNLAQAVALAGGPSERGRLDRVRLLRGGRTYNIDLAGADGAGVQMPIQSGDRIFVGRRSDLLRDNIAPLASLAGAAVSVALLFRR